MPPDDLADLDSLVAELNSSNRTAHSTGSAQLEAWLTALHQQRGSDLFLVAGLPPMMRIQHELRPVAGGRLDGREIEEAVLPVLPAQAAERYRATGVADVSWTRQGLGRFRLNLHRERGRAAATIRALPPRPPDLDELDLPAAIERLTQLSHGLVLIGGPCGSGKTTTLAALVSRLSRRGARHIITIEDPIEYDYPHQGSVIEQVEVGIDTPEFLTALRSAVRQSPDVIVIGEMRDPETMRVALAAGETGHLVFSTLHTTDVTSTVSRIADSFAPERQPTVRQELAMALVAVMTQTLLPRIGGGRVPAAELLMVGTGARQHIRKNALQHLHQEITITRKQGSFTLEESLADLAARGIVDRQVARARATHDEEFDGILRSRSR